MNKWRGRQDERKGDFEMQDLEKELADVILAAILMGDELGIDVSDAIQKKTAIVKQRREE
ncbi:MAG: hypothetical protein H6766_03870 [Candidatus Peribacteria bacterium]|nr:MAG: hypothetical protein H6766_03870 [Candidatus Peribacteria bacterium]